MVLYLYCIQRGKRKWEDGKLQIPHSAFGSCDTQPNQRGSTAHLGELPMRELWKREDCAERQQQPFWEIHPN